MRGRKWFFIRLMFPYTTPLVLALPVYTLVITVASTVLGGSQLSGFITAATLLMMASAFMLTLLINITGCRFYKHFADIREEALHQSHWLKDPQAAESALQEIPDPASTAVQAPDSGAS
ncbi:MAG: hypothetical protein IJZ74_01660 [Clostridia bacterium]|nr:hypothetical protein [Clostridia bacterium]